MLDTLFWICFWTAIAVGCFLVFLVGASAWERWCERQAMARLKEMNRGVMDNSDWVKKPWQHDAGECKRLAAEASGRVEAFAASVVQQSIGSQPYAPD